MRVGVAHHLGWAVVVTASTNHAVVDRRRIELVEPGVATAPIHHEGGAHPLHRSAETLDDNALGALVTNVRASVARTAAAALDELAAALPEPIASMSVRAWPADFPDDIAVQRRIPYEGRADSVMYCQVLAESHATAVGPSTYYNAKEVEAEAARILGCRGPTRCSMAVGHVATTVVRTIGPHGRHRIARLRRTTGTRGA